MLLPERLINLSDSELIKEYKNTGNKIIIGALYNRYSHLVFGLCMKYLKKEEDAEDLMINVFTKLMDDLLKHEVEYFKSWLYTYSKNFCLMYLRSEASKKQRYQDYKENLKVIMENPEDLHQNAVAKEIQINELEKAMEELNEEQKKCIRMFYIEQRSYQEISELTGYTLNNVKSFIQNGKRNIKIKLENLGYRNTLGFLLLLIEITK